MTKKFIVGLFSVIFSASFAFAESDDLMGGQINDTSDTSSIKPQKQLTEKQKRALNNDPKKGFLKGICKGEYIYTGCFIGVEIGAGLNNNISSTDGLDKYTTTFPINVHIGWQ